MLHLLGEVDWIWGRVRAPEIILEGGRWTLRNGLRENLPTETEDQANLSVPGHLVDGFHHLFAA